MKEEVEQWQKMRLGVGEGEGMMKGVGWQQSMKPGAEGGEGMGEDVEQKWKGKLWKDGGKGVEKGAAEGGNGPRS